MNTTLRVKEFADLSGVTVRTLQYYDRKGLLKPSGYTNNNHRMYKIDDLLRLQQILTFKYLGYGLDDIRQMLDSPSYDAAQALKSQRTALAERIVQLQKVVKSIDRTIEALDSIESRPLDWKVVRDVIAGVAASGRWDWMHSYYTPDQRKRIDQRGRKVTPQQLTQWQKEWAEVLLGFQRLMDRKRSAADPEAQRLAEKMDTLVQGFTQGDKGIEKSLGRAYGDMHKRPREEQPYSPELQRFMTEACGIFRKGRT